MWRFQTKKKEENKLNLNKVGDQKMTKVVGVECVSPKTSKKKEQNKEEKSRKNKVKWNENTN